MIADDLIFKDILVLMSGSMTILTEDLKLPKHEYGARPERRGNLGEAVKNFSPPRPFLRIGGSAWSGLIYSGCGSWGTDVGFGYY